MKIALILLAVSALAQTAEERTRQALDLLVARKYDAVYAMFTPQMKGLITLDVYSGQLNQLFDQLGKPTSIGEPKVTQVQGTPLVVIPLNWPAVTLLYQVSWNREWQIQGTYMRPAPSPRPAEWTPPGYVNPNEFTEREVTVGSDRWKLPGTLAMPKGKGPFAAVSTLR